LNTEWLLELRRLASTLVIVVCIYAQYEKGDVMKSTELTLPELALIAGTRGMLGAGAALLVSSKLNNDQRKAVGWTLFLIGLISTVPLAINVFSKRR
jgi:hypothetical protein